MHEDSVRIVTCIISWLPLLHLYHAAAMDASLRLLRSVIWPRSAASVLTFSLLSFLSTAPSVLRHLCQLSCIPYRAVTALPFFAAGLTFAAYCGDRVLSEVINQHTDRLIFYGEPTPELTEGIENIVGSTLPLQKYILLEEPDRMQVRLADLGSDFCRAHGCFANAAPACTVSPAMRDLPAVSAGRRQCLRISQEPTIGGRVGLDVLVVPRRRCGRR